MAEDRNPLQASASDMYSDNSGTLLVPKSSTSCSRATRPAKHQGQCSKSASNLRPTDRNNGNIFTIFNSTGLSDHDLRTNISDQRTSPAEHDNINAQNSEQSISQGGFESIPLNGGSAVALSVLPGAHNSTQSFHSTDSEVCRICQLTANESGEPLSESGCQCRGSMAKCHRKCLHQWVKQRMCTMCELCSTSFSLRFVEIDRIIRQNLTENRREARLRQQDGSQASSQACREQRRMWFAIIFCLLTLSTASAAGLTAHTRRQYVKSVLEARQDLQPLLPSSTIRTGLSGGLFYHSTNRQFISTKVQNAQFMYGLSAAILVCTTVLTVGVGLLWLFAEFWVWPQEVRMRQMRRQTRRLRNMRREMERAENFTIEDLSPNPVTTEGSVQIMETAV